jgi:hypothetical protein
MLDLKGQTSGNGDGARRGVTQGVRPCAATRTRHNGRRMVGMTGLGEHLRRRPSEAADFYGIGNLI